MKNDMLFNRNEQQTKSKGTASDGQIECPSCHRWMEAVLRCEDYSATVKGYQTFSLIERRSMGDWQRGEVIIGDQIDEWYECNRCGYTLPSAIANIVRDRLSGATD